LEQQLWNIANTLRGKMNADEFRDYILGFIFYKYLAEKMEIYANSILMQDKIKYRDIHENSPKGQEYIEAIKEESLGKLGYFLKPSELFSEVGKRGNGNGSKDKESNFILEDLQKILTNIQLSTMGTESEEDFDNLFEDMDLNSTKLGKTPEARNEIIAKVLSLLDKQFEAIEANPPFSAQWSANPLFTSDDRFSQYGKLAPGSKADYAFVQHMIYHLADNGAMAIVLPHGALFRGGAEQHIRKYLIEDKNFLDAVIGLPANVFYGTSIPTCILVFKKCRENPDNILFIDASQFFEKATNQYLLRPEDIDRIISSYRNRTEELKYSKLATLKEVADNDYNLNIPRYVDTFEVAGSIDINLIAQEIMALDSQMAETDKVIEAFCKELNISTPFRIVKYD
jgi:type I restriction-modification system DNA methylase subunit